MRIISCEVKAIHQYPNQIRERVFNKYPKDGELCLERMKAGETLLDV